VQRTAILRRAPAGGQPAPFAGWEMPVQYAGILQEAQAVRQRWGVFDVSHMARAYFRGADARAFLSRLVPSDLGKVAPMTGQYTVLTNERGGVVDDIILYERAPDEYLMVFNAANRQSACPSPTPSRTDATSRCTRG
jgi:aminomethyltransferase